MSTDISPIEWLRSARDWLGCGEPVRLAGSGNLGLRVPLVYIDPVNSQRTLVVFKPREDSVCLQFAGQDDHVSSLDLDSVVNALREHSDLSKDD